MPTLLSRVRSLSKSTASQTSDDEVVSSIQSGVQFVISNIPKELQWQFGTESSDITNGTGQRPASDTVLVVTRNGINCTEIPSEHIYAQEGTYSPTSLNARTVVVPGYYKKAGKIYIKPDPAVGAVGKITSVAIPTITSTTEDTDSTWYFRIIDQAIINYAAGLDSTSVASYWRTQGETLVAARSLTNVEDALSKAQIYMDNNGTVDFESYMSASEEDDLQATLMLQGAAQEVSRAGREIEKLQVNANDVVKYYEAAQLSYGKAEKFFEMAMAEIQMFIKNNSRIIQLAASSGR